MQGVRHLVKGVGRDILPVLVDLVDLNRPRSERESFDAGVAVSVIHGEMLISLSVRYDSIRVTTIEGGEQRGG